MTVESNRQEIVSIQMLRGIAALMVVFVHLDVQFKRLGYGRIGSGWMATGVDIFFVISGFIMWVTTAHRRRLTAAAFVKNRLVRIVPLYWLITFLVLASALLTPQLLHTTVFDPWHTIASFLFIPARHPTTGDFWPLLIPGWTLNMELFFYALFASSIAWSGQSLRRRFAWIATLIVGAWAVANVLRGEIDVLNFYANPIVLEFLAGVVVGIVYLSRRLTPSRIWCPVIVLGFLTLWQGQNFLPPNTPFTGVAATMIVAGALFAPPVRLMGLQTLGDASYSLYLTHVITLSGVSAAWARQSITNQPVLFCLFSVGAAIIVAVLSYRFVELPLTRALKKASAAPQPMPVLDVRLPAEQ